MNEYIKSTVSNVKETNQLKEDLQRLGNSGKGGGGELPIKWGCAAGWGRIFTTGFTNNGVAFSTEFPVELLEWGRKLPGVWG